MKDYIINRIKEELSDYDIIDAVENSDEIDVTGFETSCTMIELSGNNNEIATEIDVIYLDYISEEEYKSLVLEEYKVQKENS